MSVSKFNSYSFFFIFCQIHTNQVIVSVVRKTGTTGFLLPRDVVERCLFFKYQSTVDHLTYVIDRTVEPASKYILRINKTSKFCV